MTSTYSVVDLIRAKREGQALNSDQIAWLIRAYTDDIVADEQMSAMAMAVYFQGLDDAELSAWTTAMIKSGERMSFAGLSRPTVDKHSTGGVGDKITLPLAPLVAACGAAVPQLSGRALGHTGGTLDKMEAIPGWRADLSHDEMVAQLEKVGAVICAAGPGLAPADKKLYALRDVTGTVESIPLIASSIMSKKIAEGTDSLVLDVKTGSGAFMKTNKDARELASRLVELGEAAGVRTTALLTHMDVPLGYACGNGIEVAESLEVLGGGGPADVVELTVALARHMVKVAGLDGIDPADVLASGQAMDVWRNMVRAQGGDPDAPLPVAHHSQDIVATETGVITGIDAMSVGLAAWRLGAGRARKEDPVQAAAGVMLRVRPGDRVVTGQPLAILLTDTPNSIARAEDAMTNAFTVGQTFQPQDIVIDTVVARS
ncbi:thymidine phosphorylase [Cutibacterium acnes]|uniref:thymidine phosphorylase n=1 Tax=Cutibacterium acnes TaxID=1747 RepID=UPI0001F0905C|nr:thymidine phosphorylase [Cutibacterium acnes]EFT75780.1 pyrimidine-nucleoside phosphorylase [Cutibacterium acnes HL050PA2]